MTFKPEVIKTGGNEILLEKEKITDIFKFYSTPYICTAISGGGKTTLAIDLIYTYAKECTNIYYITATEPSLTDKSISLIPECFIRKPTYENIEAVWKEITAANSATNAKEGKIIEIIIKLYGEEVSRKLTEKIKEQQKIINERNTKMYKEQGKNTEQIKKLLEYDLAAFDYEIKRRIIIYGILDCGKLNELNERLTQEETNIINAMVSKPSKTLLIFDDMTKELKQMQMDNNKVMLNDSFVTKANAYQALVTDILTRARHFNCMVVFFVHSIEVFKSKDLIDKLVMFDGSMVQKLQNQKSFQKNMKQIISVAANKLFNNPDYKNMFLYYHISDNHISVGKASLHNTGEQIEVNAATKQFINIYNDILSGFKTAVTQDKPNEPISDEYEEDGNDSDNIDSII